jgi:hypothetical protein
MATDSVDKRVRFSRNWLVVGGLTAAVGIAACAVVVREAFVDSSGPNTEQQHQTYPGAITRIEVDLASGNLTIGRGALGEVSVNRVLRWDRAKPTITETADGATLRITEVCEYAHRCETDYTLAVPESVVVQTHVSAGDLALRDNTADVDLAVDSGRITLDNLGGKIHARTNSGEIRGTGIRSQQVGVQSGSGAIALSFADAPTTVEATADVGDIRIRVPNTAPDSGGYRVQTDTNVGTRDVTVNQEQNATRSIAAHTSTGNVSVGYV